MKVLFVCLGNICRSPAAEGIFRDMVREAGLTDKIGVDSCGTGGWHEGEAPDPRMIAHAKQRGYDISDLEARQLNVPSDFRNFDYILTMDNSNFKNVSIFDIKKEYGHKIKPLTSFCKVHEIEEVPDPYYKGDEGFHHVLDLLEDACAELLHHIKKELK